MQTTYERFKNYELTAIQIVPAENNQKRPTNTVRCSLSLDDGSIKHTEPDCLEARSWWKKFLSKKCLIMNKDLVYRNILRKYKALLTKVGNLGVRLK